MSPVTVMLTAAYFLHIMTFYFILKWVPKIVVDMGFSPSSAGGGLVGGLLFSALSLRFALRGLLAVFMLASTVMVAVFGLGKADLHGLSLAAAGGFCTNAGVVGLYALVASSFPTAIRGGGTGFVIGIGRGGAGADCRRPVVPSGARPGPSCRDHGQRLAAIALLAMPKRAAEAD